jgi:hypothetical protein
MELKTYPTIIRFFSLLIFLFEFNGAQACGWSESAEITRLALFRAERNDFLKLRFLAYSSDTYATPNVFSVKDQKQNCLEWQKKLGTDINPDDVYTILYETDSEVFQSGYQSKSLATVFAKNTFIEKLLLHKNKKFLEYLIFAKKLEYNNMGGSKWETWNSLNYGYDSENKFIVALGDYDKKLISTKDVFLKQRYAFLLLRMSYYEGNRQEVVRLYETYFTTKPNTILTPWALYFRALSSDNQALQNYYLSQVFVSCDEKTNAVMQHYDRTMTAQTLSYAQNDTEKGNILTLECMRNPSPQLEVLKQIYAYNPDSVYFSFLVGREVNKLEDWIFTPKYTGSTPSVVFENEDWYSDYEKAKAENYVKDINYLKELRTFLIGISDKTQGEQKDYLYSAIAQLCFIDDEIELGKKYVNLISKEANSTITLQSKIQLALVALKENDIQSDVTKQLLFDCFNSIENAVDQDHSLFKTMYSFYRIVAKEFSKQGDEATAGLLFLKSNTKKSNIKEYDDEGWGYYPYYYNYLGYFDRFATVKDMDNLMALIVKKNKTPFEEYICRGTINTDVNVYKDLKGTIAFRDTDLELAYKTFAEMPKDFWIQHYEYKNYLNENPFFPKILTSTKERKFDYVFNKTEFLKTLLELKKKNTAESNLKLAHAFFNVSVWGNSWMMTSYSQSGYSGDGYSDYVFGGNRSEREAKYQNGNYYNCNLAKSYYQKVLFLSKNKEEKALASLMVFECDYVSFGTISNFSNAENIKFRPGKEIYSFNTIYRNTQTFKKYNCPLLQDFIK